jgi:subtilisin family serine protease
VTVAVVDTGTRFDHPDLAGVQWGPGEGALDLVPEADNGDGNGVDRDPTDPGAPNRDPDSHGTHVAGILAARWGTFGAPCAGCSTSGVAGAVRDAPVKLLPLRVLDAFGNGDIATITQAVRYAAGETVTLNGTAYRTPHAAQIINLSLGGPVSAEEARPLCDAVAEVTARGVLVVAAAGNDGNRPPQTATGMSQPYYPAACEGAVSVAAVTLSEGDGLPVHAAYSSFYPQVMLSAPGGSTARALNGAVLNGEAFQDAIFSTSWDFERNRPNYVGMIGTSQAAPQVSAVAALMLSKGVVSNRSELVARLQATARDLGEAGRDARTGFGLVDAAAALGAPAVESSLRVLLETRTQGVAPTRVALPLEESGAFSGFVRGGPYRVVALLDSDGDGLDESGEPRGSVEVAVGEQNPEQEVTVRLSR